MAHSDQFGAIVTFDLLAETSVVPGIFLILCRFQSRSLPGNLNGQNRLRWNSFVGSLFLDILRDLQGSTCTLVCDSTPCS